MCVRLTLNPLTQNYEIWHAESFFKTKTIESRVNDLAQSCILAYVQLGLKNSRHPTAYPCYQMPPFPTKTFFRGRTSIVPHGIFFLPKSIVSLARLYIIGSGLLLLKLSIEQNLEKWFDSLHSYR